MSGSNRYKGWGCCRGSNQQIGGQATPTPELQQPHQEAVPGGGYSKSGSIAGNLPGANPAVAPARACSKVDCQRHHQNAALPYTPRRQTAQNVNRVRRRVRKTQFFLIGGKKKTVKNR